MFILVGRGFLGQQKDTANVKENRFDPFDYKKFKN